MAGAEPPGPAALRVHLQALKALRGTGHAQPPRLAELKAWQSRRLAKTYADLASQPRYRAATEFFLDDLYGPKDFSARDEELLRIVPVMARVLPHSAVETASLAVELEAVSEALDHALARALAGGPITEESYAQAYRTSSTREERMHQLDLIEAVGLRLDALVAKPLVAGTLKLMRKPAHLAGLGDLQDFLETGFEAFRTMKGSGAFLAVLRGRETEILNRLFSGASRPFSV
ncbi:MAG TPA: hypothetical protein VEG27_08730 [Usitatibacter sp.]|nr:hypothetical protein [Usitatibacter sp.]